MLIGIRSEEKGKKIGRYRDVSEDLSKETQSSGIVHGILFINAKLSVGVKKHC